MSETMIEFDTPPPRRARILRVAVKDYKSIKSAKIELGNFNILVGRNGAGKSNFLDLLHFMSEALTESLETAIRRRGGVNKVRRHSTGHPRNFGCTVDVELPSGRSARYSFEVAAAKNNKFNVKRERLLWIDEPQGIGFDVSVGELKNPARTMPPASPNRLYLVNAAGLPEFRELYDALCSMGFYNLNPDVIKQPQTPTSDQLLQREGRNLSSVIARIKHDHPDTTSRITDYLQKVAPLVEGFDRIPAASFETVEFRVRVKGSENGWKFSAQSMSDGTLRALAILVAVQQTSSTGESATLIGIEEPETALHPAAAGALVDALREASDRSQIVITTHSPELLDGLNHDTDRLYVVAAEESVTRIAQPDKASIDTVKEGLISHGELLRLDQLELDPEHVKSQKQLTLFE